MIKFLQQLILYLGFDFRLNRATAEPDISNFLRQMHPVKTDKDLIRVGSMKDGGYLIPDDLQDLDAVLSPGVGNKQDFDMYFADKGVKVFMADASVEGPIENHPNFSFIKKFLGVFDDGEHISLESWCKEIGIRQEEDLLLQMDIEGSEYEVLYGIPQDLLHQFRIIVIEFHDLDMLWNRMFFNKFKNSFFKLLNSHYVVHIHPNNCRQSLQRNNIEIPPVLEVTFYRKDRAEKIGYADKFPHKLDADCTSRKPLNLPKSWRRQG